MRNLKLYFLFILSLFLGGLRAQNIVSIDNIESIEIIEPKTTNYKIIGGENPTDSILKTVDLPFLKPSRGIHCLELNFTVTKKTSPFYLKFPYLNAESISAFLIHPNGTQKELFFGKNNNNFIYTFQNLEPGSYSLIFKIKSSFAIFFPVKFMSQDKLEISEKKDNLIYAMYFGIIIIMSLYNLFVYFSTKSISYLYYVIYTIGFGAAQFGLLGYFHAFYGGNNFILSKQFSVIFSGISGVFGIFFFNSFLESKTHLKIVRKILLLLAMSYTFVIATGLLKTFIPAFNLLNINAITTGVVSLGGSAWLAMQGNRPAKFFLFAWIAFMIGLVVVVLTNIGLAPYNNITKFMLPLTSAIEISLLSFALADKINILSAANATLIREQNAQLEIQVTERTSQLLEANENLKQTQAQLVNSEKMASLGHLTAGIAHEINNPINFISANISPLRRDIEDYELMMKLYSEITEDNYSEKMEEISKTSKEIDIPYVKTEIETLLKGIDEGAKRTSEIVKNLKIFSHIDKAENSYYSVSEGIASTLHLLSHKLGKVEVTTELENLPPLLCFPGKLNQVFMNLLSNAIDAVENAVKPTIHIKSYSKEEYIFIEISDNGHGIPKEIQKDIFNPFFTTKDVGSGTGLGLSITISIVHEHGGDIYIESEPEKGSTFTIKLPVKL